jgi:hypothetical protein
MLNCAAVEDLFSSATEDRRNDFGWFARIIKPVPQSVDLPERFNFKMVWK